MPAHNPHMLQLALGHTWDAGVCAYCAARQQVDTPLVCPAMAACARQILQGAPPLDQRRVYQQMQGPAGDCLPACLATLLGVPLTAIPNYCAKYGTRWLEELQGWLKGMGYAAVMFGHTPGWHPPGYALLAGKSPRGGWLHSVVCLDGAMVHDPHPSGDGVHHPYSDWLIVYPLDPWLGAQR